MNNNKNLNNLQHSLSLNQNVHYQPSYNNISKLVKPDKPKNFYHFYEKQNSKKFQTNFK